MVRQALKPLFYYILLSLAAEDRHGQSIARDVHELSTGQVRLWPATLYGALDELEAAGLIAELTDARRPADESARKRYYRITRFGRQVAAAEAARLAELVADARARRLIRDRI